MKQGVILRITGSLTAQVLSVHFLKRGKMNSAKFWVAIAVLLGLSATGFADVQFNSVFRVEGLSIRADIEPADSNLYHHIRHINCDVMTMDTAKPLLPVAFVSLVIPSDEEVAGVEINYALSTKIEIPGEYWVYPCQPPKYLTGISSFVPPDSATYASNLPYPGELVKVGWVGYRSGYKIVNLRIYPVQFTPAQKKLELWTNIYFTIRTRTGQNLAVPVYRRSELSQRIIEAYIKALVSNPEAVQKGEMLEVRIKKPEIRQLVITGLPSIEGECVDYVIITNEVLKDTFETLAAWKTKKGVVTQVRTVEWIDQNYWGCDIAEKMRNFISDAYSYWGTIWVLLAGDVEFVSARRAIYDSHLGSWGPTDLYFSGLEGNWNANGNHQFGEDDDNCDLYPDLFIGRASVENREEGGIFVRKVLTYEKNPPTDYLTRIMLLGASLEPSGYWLGWGCKIKERLQKDAPYGASLDFIFGQENIYELYGPRYDPEYPPPNPLCRWEGDDELTAANAIAAMNSGSYHIINHADHCDYYNMGMGRETGGGYLYRDDAMNLTNGPNYFILWTLGCAPNAFDHKSISEAVLNAPNGGAVAYIGNSRTAWATSTIEYQDVKFFRTLFVDSLYNIGIPFASTQNPDTFWTYECTNMNLLGDPQMPVWTGAPHTLSVAHPFVVQLPESVITVTVTGMQEGDTAVVCLQKGTEAYGVATIGYPSTTAEFIIKCHTLGYLSVTVTCPNYFSYEGLCYIAPADGPYLCPHSYFVFDDSLDTWGKVNGNKDGILNPGEVIQLYLSIGNSGGAGAYGVYAKLRTADPFVHIRDSVVYYYIIHPGEVVYKDTLTGGYFGFYLDPDYNLGKYHQIPFEIFIEEWGGENGGKSPHPGEWRYSLLLTEFCDSLAHSGQKVVDVPNRKYIYPQITNLGWGSARGVKAILRAIFGPSPVRPDTISYFGEIKPGETILNETDPFIIPWPANNLQIVMRDYYGREWIEPLVIETISPPDSVWAYPDERAIDICWKYEDIPAATTLAGYNVYRAKQVGPVIEWEKLNSVLITEASYYRDDGLLDWRMYSYRTTAVDTSGNESEFSEIAYQRTFPPYQQGFPVTVPVGPRGLGFYYSSPAVADVDGDGEDEIAIGAEGWVYLINHDGTIPLGWPVYLGDNISIHSSPALADINNNGVLEIIIGTGGWWGSSDYKVHCFNVVGEEMPGWPIALPSWVYASPVVANIDDDYQNEILAVTMAGDAALYAWEADGSNVPGFPFATDASQIFESPVVADFDNDGTEEIFLQTSGSPTGNLLLLKYDPAVGEVYIMPGWPQIPGSAAPFPANPTICDIDNDNSLEILVADRINNRVCCFNFDGTLQWQFTNITNTLITNPTPGDINIDGYVEVVFVDNNGHVYALDNQGALLWQTKTFSYATGGTWAKASQGIVISNVDDDIYPEILFSCKERLWILKDDGKIMKGAPFRLECDGHSTPALADLDKDGDLEVICASGGDCELKVWDLITPFTQSEWQMFQHDIKHTGRYEYIDAVPPTARIISPMHGAYLMPQDSLPIFGTAKDLHFTNYRLKYYNPFTGECFPVEPDSYATVPVDSGLLGYWNTTALTGDYALCLEVSDSFDNVSADTIKVNFLPIGATPPIVDPEFAIFSSFPIDVATDALNYVYVTDTGDDKIWKFSEEGDSLLVFSYDFNHPKGVAVDENGFIWVTDCLNHCVKLFDPFGTFVYKFGKHGNNPGEFKQPCGVAIDGNGSLWICDNKNDRVQKFNSQGNFILQIPEDKIQKSDAGQVLNQVQGSLAGKNRGWEASPTTDNERLGDREISLKQPTGVSVLGAMVYITDSKNNRVVVFDTSGNFIRIIGETERLKQPWDNQVDCFSNLFVADVHNDQIIEFNPWGYKLLAFGVKGSGPGQFKKPHGVAVSTDGKYLYVCDTYNNRIQKFQMYLGPEGKRVSGPMALGDANLLKIYALYQNYPNPFRKATEFKYQIAEVVSVNKKAEVSLKIYDVTGRLVKTLVNEPKVPGIHTVRWDATDNNGRNVSSGVYFIKLNAGDFGETRKTVLLR